VDLGLPRRTDVFLQDQKWFANSTLQKAGRGQLGINSDDNLLLIFVFNKEASSVVGREA